MTVSSAAVNATASSFHAASRTATFNRDAKTVDASGFAHGQDEVDISSEYRAAQAAYAKYNAGYGIAVENGFQMNVSTKDIFVGATSESLRAYSRMGGGGDVRLTAINASRETLGRRIDSIIQTAGVKLGKNEKLKISVGADNKIKVGGIKDKTKAAQIEKALNDDKSLGQEIRRHYAHGKPNNYSKQKGDFARQHQDDWKSEHGDMDDMYANRGIRSFIIDDYLCEKTGLGLSDLW